MTIEQHHDRVADIARLRFENFDPERAVSAETDFGLSETVDGEVVALEFWKASERLPRALWTMLPSPPVAVGG
jgi:uncharacterized protein YuzE